MKNVFFSFFPAVLAFSSPSCGLVHRPVFFLLITDARDRLYKSMPDSTL